MVTTKEFSSNARGCSTTVAVRLLPGSNNNNEAKKCFYTKCMTCKHTKYVGPHVESSFVMVPRCEMCPNEWVLQSYEEELSSVAKRATDMSPDELFNIITGKLKEEKSKTTQTIPTSKVDDTIRNSFPQWFNSDIFTDNTRNEFVSARSKVMEWIFNGKYHGKSFIGSYMKVGVILEPYVNLFEDTAFLLYNLINASNSVGRYISIVAFCKLRGSRLNSASALATVLGNILFDKIKDTREQDRKWDEMRKHVIKEVGADFQPQSYDDEANPFKKLREYMNRWDKIKESVIIKKLERFSLYILTLGILDKFNINFKSLNYSKWEEESLKRKHGKGLGMLECFLDTALFVCERGHEFFYTGDPNTIFHSGSDYEKWVFQSQKLCRDALVLNNPEPHGVNKFQFLSDLKDAIERGKGIVKFTAKLEKGERLQLQKLLNDLQLIETTELTKREAQRPRKDPFGVLLHGSSSIGKSQLKQILFYHYAKCFNLPCGPEYMYTRVPADEFWSGFTTSQWCIVMDDIAFLRPTGGELDPSLAEMLQVKNSVPFVPPQAELNDKGRTPVRPELLIATTNTKELNLQAYFACPFAVARRLGYIITARIKPEYSKWNICADSKKIPITEDGEYMNIWNFIISVAVPATDKNVDAQQTKYVEIHQFDDINAMLQWYITTAKEHEVSQQKALSADDTMSKIVVCQTCYRSSKHCICKEETESVASEMYFEEQAADNDDASTHAWDRQIFNESILDMRKVTKLKVWFVGNTICHSPNTVWYEEEMLIYWSMIHPIKWLILIFGLLNSISFAFCFFLIAFVVLLIKYCWIISAYCYQWKYGTYWKVRLASSILANEASVWQLIFRLAGNRVNLALHRVHPHAKIIATFITSIVATELAVRWISKKFTGETAGKTNKHLMQTVKDLRDGKITQEEYKELRKGYGKKVAIQSVTSIAGSAALYAGWMTNSASEGVTPEPADKEKPVFYYHDPYVVTDVDISTQSRCARPGTIDTVIQGNLAKFQFIYYDIRRRRTTTAVNIHGNVWCFNKHVLKGEYECHLTVILDPITQNVSRNTRDILITKNDIRMDDEHDLAFIELRCIAPGKSLLSYLPLNETIGGCHKGTYFMIDSSGSKTCLHVKNIRRTKCPMFGVDAYLGMVDIPTIEGDCGSVCVATICNAQVILGIHTGGNLENHVIMHHLSQNHFRKYFDPLNYISRGVIRADAPGYERKLVPVHSKAAVRFIEQGTGHVMGSFAGYRPCTKSKVSKTYICDYVRDEYPVQFGPPPMGWQPWAKAMRDMACPSFTFDNNILRQCVIAYIVDIRKALPDLSSLEVYDLNTALNGADGVTYVDKMNLNTSAGLPFRGAKKKYIEIDEHGKVSKIDDCIMQRMELILESYNKGERFHPLFCNHLKDDPLEWKKIMAFKTRVFSGGEYAWSIIVRRFFLSHVRMIQNNPFIFEAMPGIVAQSEQWHELYDHLTKFGENRMVAGDYGKYDKNMAAPFILGAFDILISLSQAAGWSPDDLKVLRCIAYDTAFPTSDFHGDLIEMQGNPSGHPLTVIINCIVNSLYMRYAYVVTTGKSALSFKDHVSLATYGDDNAMSIKDDCDLFNHTSISKVLASIGVEYTMADKESESVPFIHIDQISFLKRVFRWDDEIKSFMAVLEEKSINKMLTAYVDNGILAPEAHSVQAIETALREYFFHGRSKFEERSVYFKTIVEKANLSDWVRDSTFPRYDQMAIDFWKRHITDKNALIAAERIAYFGAAMGVNPSNLGDNPSNQSAGFITLLDSETDI